MIESAEIYTAQVPMRMPFVHAAKSRRRSASVLVKLCGGGLVGWGEGAPRSYVTGESIDSVVAACASIDLRRLSREIHWQRFGAAIRDIARFSRNHRMNGGRPSPAAAAAVELACLDLVCRRHGKYVGEAVPNLLPEECLRPAGDFPVSSVVGLSREPERELGRIAAGTLHQIKLKVPADAARAPDLISLAREVSAGGVPICVDANGAWAVEDLEPVADSLRSLAWLEEPLAPRAWSGLARLRERYGLTVMLDESAVMACDLRRAVDANACDAVNIRVSKCGGLCAAARMIGLCRVSGVRFQIGVQVGEIGPLWAAGRALAAAVRGPLAIEAGRQDEWFDVPLTSPPFFVDRKTNRAAAPDGPGLGVAPSPALSRYLVPAARRVL